MIDKGADVNAKDNIGLIPLYRAAEGGNRDIVELLISKGADINSKDNIGGTVLHFLAIAEVINSEMFEFLITKGVDVNARTNDGITPSQMAADNGHKGIVELLIAKGADVNAKGLAELLSMHNTANKIDLLHSIKELVYDDREVLALTEKLKSELWI